MIIQYEIKFKENVAVAPSSKNIESHSIQNSTVRWEINDENRLYSARLIFDNLKINFINSIDTTKKPPETIKVINPNPPLDIFKQAYKIVTYISNRIFAQTGIDAIDIHATFQGTPSVFPETDDEKADFKRFKTRIAKKVKISWQNLGEADLSDYSEKFSCSSAFIYYADGLRVNNPFIRFELFYKVIEYFFDKGHSSNDTIENAAHHICKFDRSYTKEKINNIKDLRNRCIHPQARRGHASPDDISALNEVEQSIKELKKLCELLIDNPPIEQ